MMVYTTEKLFTQEKLFFIHPLEMMVNLSIIDILPNMIVVFGTHV